MTEMDSKAHSLDEQSSMVRRAFCELMDSMQETSGGGGMSAENEDMPDKPEYQWVIDVYPDSVIICDESGAYWQAGYILDANGVTFDDQANWTKVEKEWVVSKNVEPLAFIGGDVKALGSGKVGGYLIRFTDAKSPDLEGEFFDAKSALDLKNGDRLSVYYEHGYDSTLKTRILGDGKVEIKDAGIWYEAQLKIRDAYEKYVYQMAEDGKLGWSSAPAQHLIRKSRAGGAVHIDVWPVKDATLTPKPAEARNMAIPLKALPRIELKSLIPPENAQEGEPPAQGVDVQTKESVKDIQIMNEQPTNANAPEVGNDVGKRLDAFEAQMKSFGDMMTTLVDRMEKTPKGEGVTYTNMGGTQDKQVKSLGDYCLAVKRKDTARIYKVYGGLSADEYDKGVKALSEDQGATGGYMIPPDFSAELVTAQSMVSPILNMVRSFPVNSPAGEWPVLDIYRTVTAGSGNTPMAGGLISSVITEGGTFTDRNVYFKIINWRVAKNGDILNVSAEMSEDAGALDALLRQVMTTALASRKEYGILRGTGVGEPLGIINAPALISYNPATSNVFAYADSVGMVARMKMLGGDPARVAFLHHISVLPDVASFQTGSAGTSLVQSISGTDPSQLALWTKRLIQSEHLPQADNDNSVILADLGSYGIWQRGAISIAYSTDYAFNTDQVTWRFRERYDGRPLAVSSVTLADPQGSYTQSPFVGLNATHV